MRCRDDAESDHRKKEKKTTGACRRTRARQAPEQIHHNAWLKHSKSSTDRSPAVLMEHHGNSKVTGTQEQLAHHIQIPTRSVHRMFRIRSHGSFSCCTPNPRTRPRRAESWRIGYGDFDTSNTRIFGMSRGPPSNGVCSRDLVMSRASSEPRIFPLTASAVTRATTSLHTSPPFTVVRLVRDLMSVRVHAARFLPPTMHNSRST